MSAYPQRNFDKSQPFMWFTVDHDVASARRKFMIRTGQEPRGVFVDGEKGTLILGPVPERRDSGG